MIERITKFETDGKLMIGISKKQGLPPELVAKMLRYNVLTANQLAQLTGLTLNQVNNKTRPGIRNAAELVQVGVFPEWDEEEGKEKDGRLFILRNDATEKLLMKCNGVKI